MFSPGQINHRCCPSNCNLGSGLLTPEDYSSNLMMWDYINLPRKAPSDAETASCSGLILYKNVLFCDGKYRLSANVIPPISGDAGIFFNYTDNANFYFVKNKAQWKRKVGFIPSWVANFSGEIDGHYIFNEDVGIELWKRVGGQNILLASARAFDIPGCQYDSHVFNPQFSAIEIATSGSQIDISTRGQSNIGNTAHELPQALVTESSANRYRPLLSVVDSSLPSIGPSGCTKVGFYIGTGIIVGDDNLLLGDWSISRIFGGSGIIRESGVNISTGQIESGILSDCGIGYYPGCSFCWEPEIKSSNEITDTKHVTFPGLKTPSQIKLTIAGMANDCYGSCDDMNGDYYLTRNPAMPWSCAWEISLDPPIFVNANANSRFWNGSSLVENSKIDKIVVEYGYIANPTFAFTTYNVLDKNYNYDLNQASWKIHLYESQSGIPTGRPQFFIQATGYKGGVYPGGCEQNISFRLDDRNVSCLHTMSTSSRLLNVVGRSKVSDCSNVLNYYSMASSGIDANKEITTIEVHDDQICSAPDLFPLSSGWTHAHYNGYYRPADDCGNAEFVEDGDYVQYPPFDGTLGTQTYRLCATGNLSFNIMPIF